MKGSGLALGGLAIAGSGIGRAASQCTLDTGDCYPTPEKRDAYTLFSEELDTVTPPLRPAGMDELRITFMGSGFPPARPAQEMMSVFVEVGPGSNGTAPDQFIFDCGSGVMGNYTAMNVGFKKMDKVFLNHLHGDHMSDLTCIYTFGPATDRKKPLYVWGPGPSRVKSPTPPRRLYDDGTTALCRNLREACRWHTESFSFLPTAVEEWRDETPKWGLPVAAVNVGDDPPGDGFALYAIELDWTRVGVAYENHETGVRITHFPVVHARKGSVGYKLEWNGLSMIYTSDTRPETMCVQQASSKETEGKGVDVFIHEMVPPPEASVVKALRLPRVPDPVLQPELYEQFQKHVALAATVYENSHTPQGAFGYLLNQIDVHPRLTVAAHFTVADDTIACAKKSVWSHCKEWIQWLGKDAIGGATRGYMTWACDLMVITVTKDEIKQYRADVDPFAMSPLSSYDGTALPPKYPSPTAAIDTTNVIQPGPDTYCESGY
ncbi:hypothetical protein [Anaeromyxobacter terrae]|uniref:hypothetical protein n=1 Tax=Anaeromyxobacter terrae TaxID=2925406 RepID=UPI001F5906E4|nr:hypothetical protein [Anaeromyxobacter sp. SG22]